MKLIRCRIWFVLPAAVLQAYGCSGSTSRWTWVDCKPGGAVECATVKEPLDWADPHGGQLEYFVQRARAPAPATRALVFVAGGPGASGDDGIRIAESVRSMVPDMDVVAPDHRGAGRSTWFGCDKNQPSKDLTAACLQQVEERYGAKASTYFSATQAAKDLHDLVSMLRGEGLRVFMYGESYGTFLVNRFLQLYPSDVEAVVLDSTVQPDGHEEFDEDPANLAPNHAAHDIFTACANDEFCLSKLGPDPWGALGSLEQQVAGGFCASAIPAGTTDPVQWLKGTLFQLEQTYPGAAETALIYRLRRCSTADIQALAHVWDAAFRGAAPADGAPRAGCLLTPDGAPSGSCPDAGWFSLDGSPQVEIAPAGDNELLRMNIVLSDTWRLHPTASAYQQVEALTYVSDPSKLSFFSAIPQWPWAPYDPGVPQGWATTSVPLLILEGSLDPKDPPDPIHDAQAAFTAPHQQMVVVPNAVHVVLEHSAVTASTGGRTCGLEIVGSFLADPWAPLATKCTQEVPPLDFRGDSTLALTVFGTSDCYE